MKKPDEDGVIRIRVPGFKTAAEQVERILARGEACTIEIFVGDATEWSYRASQPKGQPWTVKPSSTES